jgi:hypothetical protein
MKSLLTKIPSEDIPRDFFTFQSELGIIEQNHENTKRIYTRNPTAIVHNRE